jgi:hypothetical protein
MTEPRVLRGFDPEVSAMTTTRLAAAYAVLAAAASLVFAPLLALSYFGIDEGADELTAETVSAWAEPARDLAGGLLTWASPDRVYATYVQVFALLFPAVLLCARAAHARRPVPGARLERWGWRIALAGYWLAAVGLLAAFIVLFGGSTAGSALNIVFVALMMPGMLLSVLGSTVLGIALLRAGYTPRLTAWLLALSFPLMLLGSDMLGHNSLGMVPLFLAWAATGRRLWRTEPSRAQSPLQAKQPHATA